MNALYDRALPRDVKSPVRASYLSINWISLSFFKQLKYREQLPGSLGRE